MLNRRLIILFVIICLGFCALTARLIELQLVDDDKWRDIVRAFAHRTRPIETYRGAILDRNGFPLAHDVPADELAIDYRAMNLDDRWLADTAHSQLVASGEWDKLPDRASRLRRRNEVKVELATKIDGIPDAIAEVCQIPREEVYERFQEIRARIHALRQDFWSHNFDPNPARARAASTQDSASGFSHWWDSLWGRPQGVEDDFALDQAFHDTTLKDELIAHTIRTNISPAVANYFRQHAADFPGLIVRDNANRRDYPVGEATAHITGTLRSVTPGALKGSTFKFPDLLNPQGPDGQGNLAGYLPGDRMGESGTEQLLEPVLRGPRGARLIDLDEAGGESTQDSRRVDPAPGKDVRLTIDGSYQRDVFNSLQDPSKHLLRGRDGKNHFVAIVVLSIDGQILSLISYPSYDPNTIDDMRVQLNQDNFRTPLVNRATSALYQPGSTVKPLLATAALTEQLITPQTDILCTGHFYPNRPDVFKCDEVHGDVQLVQAISESCNIYFYTVGQRMGLDRLAKWYDLYGLGRDTGMELPESRGTIPHPAPDLEPDAATRLSLFAGIGQGPISVTPLQMANAYATLLRGGQMVAPRLLLDSPVKQSQPVTLSPSYLAVVRQGMEQCTTTGTAKSVFSSFHLPVAGKTGTAQTVRIVYDDNGSPVDDTSKPLKNPDGTPQLKPDGSPAYKPLVAQQEDDAWFIGYAPADKPQFIVATIMESGGHGGTEAAPMAREAFLQLQRHNYLPHMDIP